MTAIDAKKARKMVLAVENWNGKTRDGDTDFIAQAIRALKEQDTAS